MGWLYDLITADEGGRAPQFAEQSAVNWIDCLRFEAEREHGLTVQEQAKSVRAIAKTFNRAQRSNARTVDVFEALFRAVTNTIALERLATLDPGAWHRPAAAVTWYYTNFTCVMAIFAAQAQTVGENHTAARNTFANSLQARMPHPFNMVATRSSGENYDAALPNYPAAEKYDIGSTFIPSAETAQGMLLEYLSGTSRWYATRTKEDVLRQSKGAFANFRSAEAKVARDNALQQKVAFMHCAYRYRGKVNYRDGVFLTYGNRELSNAGRYITGLAVTARVFTLFAVAVVERILGPQNVRDFVEDLNFNLRSVTTLEAKDQFWRHMLPA